MVGGLLSLLCRPDYKETSRREESGKGVGHTGGEGEVRGRTGELKTYCLIRPVD